MANLVGTTLGQYEITALLGSGDMADVYRARQEVLKRNVAIKVLRSELFNDPEFFKHFQREAETIAALNHPHIIRIYDYGEQNGVAYLVMDYLTGGSLDDLIKREGNLSPSKVSIILDQIASALDYAHKRGIVHRDLKPHNVLFDESGSAILTDFGITKLMDKAGNLTQTGAVIGTPAYMAPEQWQGLPIDSRTDRYALGVIAYEMLTGHVPYTGSSPVTIMHRALTEQPRPLASYRSDLPEAMEAVIQKSLTKTQEGRYAAAGEFAAAFRATISTGTSSANSHDEDRTFVQPRRAQPDLESQGTLPVAAPRTRSADRVETPRSSRTTAPVKSDVNFTAFFPRTVQLDTRYLLCVYAHLPSVLTSVQTDAQKFTQELGGHVPPPRTTKERAQLEQGQEVTIIPVCDGIVFDPPMMTKRWYVPYTRYEFDMRTNADHVGQELRGHILITIAGIQIAHLDFEFEIVAAESTQPVNASVPMSPILINSLAAAKRLQQSKSTRIYDKIFVSYSRKDKAVAEAYRLAQLALGNDVFMDTYSIRTGADWRAALADAIDKADIFQLFWSANAATSANVSDEWHYALHYRCPENHCVEFIRPIYWKAPIPVQPPAELNHLNFRYVPLTHGAFRLGEWLARLWSQIRRVLIGQHLF